MTVKKIMTIGNDDADTILRYKAARLWERRGYNGPVVIYLPGAINRHMSNSIKIAEAAIKKMMETA